MKNALQTFLEKSAIDEGDAMDQLQDAGIISDNCDSIADVAVVDCARAIAFLKLQE